MNEVRNLYIYGQPDMSRIKEAKASLNLDYLVIPVNLNTPAAWDKRQWDRVLAWGVTPSNACDYAPVSDKTSSDGLVAAMRWVLGEVEEDPRAVSASGWLNKILGPGVKEWTSGQVEEYTHSEDLKKVSGRLKLHEPGNSRDR